MKVLLITDYFQPKFPYSKEIIAQKLQHNGHTVRVVTSDRFFPFPNYAETTQAVLGDRVQKTGVVHEGGVTIVRNKTKLEIFSRVWYKGIAQEVHTFKPDKIIVFGAASPSAIIAAKVAAHIGARLTLVDSHLPSELDRGTLMQQVAKNVFYGIFRLVFAKKISSVTTQIIAQQDATVALIKNTYGLTSPIQVIPNGTDVDQYYFDKSAGVALRTKLNIPKTAFVVIYTGKIIAAKGVELLLESFSTFHKKVPNSWCVIVGEGPNVYKEQCRNKLSGSAAKHCLFVGFEKPLKLRAYYSMADVAVWPLQDSFAMNDAAACELVFIANDTLGDQTRISNNNAVLYKKSDTQDLASKLEYLYHHPAERKKMGKRGRVLAETVLSWDTIAQQFLAT